MAKDYLTSAIESGTINTFPTKIYTDAVEFLQNVIILSDKSLYFGETLIGKEIPHGFGIELTPSRKIIRVGYFYNGKKHGFCNSFGIDKSNVPYKTKGFYKDGLLHGYAKIK